MAILSNGKFYGFLCSAKETGQKLANGVKEYVDDFVTGFAGHGWKIWEYITGKWKLEIDTIVVRDTMVVFELLIQKIRAVKGALNITQASGKIKTAIFDESEEVWLITIEDEMTFVAHDIIRCQDWSKGTIKGYWVKISEVRNIEGVDTIIIPVSEFTGGIGYVDGIETVKADLLGMSVPAPGDEIVQFGNSVNVNRQSAIYLHADEGGQPSIDILFGIKSKSFVGCVKQRIGGDIPGTDGLKGFYCENGMIKGVDSSGHTVYCIYPDGSAEFGDGSAKFNTDRSGYIAGGAIEWEWSEDKQKCVCTMKDVVLTWDNLDDEVKENLKGEAGTDGLSIVWKGDLVIRPTDPQRNWVYRDTTTGLVYIYNGSEWNLMIADGNDGIDGTNGSDGMNVYITYHDSEAEPQIPSGDGTTGGWHTNSSKEVVWMSQKVAESFTAGIWGDPIKIKGEQGMQGLQGIQGDKGEQGIQGNSGENGESSYFHIKYSSISNPTLPEQMTETPSEFIGTYVDCNPTDSNDPGRYKWARFQGLQGETGEQGIPGEAGEKGETGQTSYLHIKYSDDGGKTFTVNSEGVTTGETPGAWIGVLVDFELNDSIVPSDYKWNKVKGEDGKLPDWLEEWNGYATTIGDGFIVTPKLFSGIKSADGKLTGITQGKECLIDKNTGEKRTGMFALVGDDIVFELDPVNDIFKFKGKIEATTGAKIGGFKIEGKRLTSIDSTAVVEIGSDSGTRFLKMNEYGFGLPNEALLRIRNDTGGAISLSGGGSKPALEIDSSGKAAIYSFGSHLFGCRANERWNAPGVLAAGHSNGNDFSYWQQGAPLKAWQEGVGSWIVEHNLGTTDYYVMIQAQEDLWTTSGSSTLKWKNANQFSFRVRYGGSEANFAWDLIIVGNNYNLWSKA